MIARPVKPENGVVLLSYTGVNWVTPDMSVCVTTRRMSVCITSRRICMQLSSDLVHDQPQPGLRTDAVRIGCACASLAFVVCMREFVARKSSHCKLRVVCSFVSNFSWQSLWQFCSRVGPSRTRTTGSPRVVCPPAAGTGGW